MRFVAICVLPLATSYGLVLGGSWNWLGLAVYFALYLILDSLLPDDTTPPETRGGPLLSALLFLQAPLLLVAWLGFLISQCGSDGLMPAAARSLGITIVPRDPPDMERLASCLSFAVTISVTGTVTAHELVHRTWSPISQLVGRMLLAFIFDAAFAIEHVYGHHARACCAGDPASARRGENVYRFIVRSTLQSFRSAWEIERNRLVRRDLPLWSWHNRNLRGIALSLALVAATAAAAGMTAMWAFILSAAIAKAMLEMVNYIEHYGLVRAPGMRVGPRHSWDTAAPMSAAGMLNLGRHAAHHTEAKPYWTQALETGSPKLPAGLLASALLSFVPPLWRWIMAPRLAHWDREQATAVERDLAREADRVAHGRRRLFAAASGRS